MNVKWSWSRQIIRISVWISPSVVNLWHYTNTKVLYTVSKSSSKVRKNVTWSSVQFARIMEMAQIQAFGLRIDMGFSSGQLSLHEYRKFLSRQDNSKMSPTSPRPRLKRKPAALDLCQKSHHDLGFQLQSPVSSAPSSPPPLSFSKSVISLPGGDLPTPISPISIVKPFSRHVSSSHSFGARRMVGVVPCAIVQPNWIFFVCQNLHVSPVYTLHCEFFFIFLPIISLSSPSQFWFSLLEEVIGHTYDCPWTKKRVANRLQDPFSARLKKPTQDLASHSRTSSGSTLPSTSAPAFKVKHNGAEFEILNPKVILHFSSATTLRTDYPPFSKTWWKRAALTYRPLIRS